MDNAARNGARRLVLSLLFVLPLVFSSAYASPFSAPKNSLLVITACTMAALAPPLRSVWESARKERCILIAAAAYVVLTALSAMLSSRPSACVQSVEFLVCGLLLFVASLEALAGKDRTLNIRNLQIAIAGAAALVSLLTVMQFFSINVLREFGLSSESTSRMRMYATLGNPDFVATFLSVAIPSAIGLSINAQRSRALWISVSVLIGLATILTGSRGGVLAFSVGLTVLALTAMRKRVLILVTIVVVFAMASVTYLNPRTPWQSLRGRLFIWQVSLGGEAARSAIGSGPGTFSYNYPVRLGQFFALSGHESLLHFGGHERHAQNDFVEAWHDTGWLGLGTLLALLGFWFTVATRRLHQSDDETKPMVAAAIASVSGLCVASLSDFPMHRAETWTLLWVCMAVPQIPPTVFPAPSRRAAWRRYAGSALLLTAGSYAALAPLVASYQLAQGESNEIRGFLESSQIAYRSALRWEPSSPDANFDLTRVIAKTGDYPAALAQSRIATRYVNEPELYLLRSRILQNAGRNREARLELEAAIRLFPYSTELRNEAASYSSRKDGE